MSSILIAEDNAQIAAFVEKGLRAAGYQTETVTDGQTALTYALHGGFDLLILDIGLPVMDGFAVLEQMRGQGSDTRVIILTARDSVSDTVSALDGGANDYITKPFQFAELLARVRLQLRENVGQEAVGAGAALLKAGDLALDLMARRAQLPGGAVDLTSREFSLLEVLLQNRGQVLSRPQLLSHAWGMDFDPGSNVVDVCIRALRAKIGAHRIETVRGVGYRVP